MYFVIETNRCKIIKLQNNDYEDVGQLYFDKKVREFLGGIVDKERYDSSFKSMMNSYDNSFYWVVRLKDSNEFIGLVSLDEHHDGLNKEVSYQFMPKYWGHGYAQEVIIRIINYAFEELKLTKVVAETQSANKASCKLLQRAYMSLEKSVERFGTEQYVFSISKAIDN